MVTVYHIYSGANTWTGTQTYMNSKHVITLSNLLQLNFFDEPSCDLAINKYIHNTVDKTP